MIRSVSEEGKVSNIKSFGVLIICMGMSDGVVAGALAEGAVVGMTRGNSGDSKERSRRMWIGVGNWRWWGMVVGGWGGDLYVPFCVS